MIVIFFLIIILLSRIVENPLTKEITIDIEWS